MLVWRVLGAQGVRPIKAALTMVDNDIPECGHVPHCTRDTCCRCWVLTVWTLQPMFCTDS